MSGKCEKCGKHTLECRCGKHIYIPDSESIFFYRGKFFQEKLAFIEYVKNHTAREITVEDFNYIFDIFKKDIWSNLCAPTPKITNGKLKSVLEEAFHFILEKCWEQHE